MKTELQNSVEITWLMLNLSRNGRGSCVNLDKSLDFNGYGYITSRVCRICNKYEYPNAEVIDNHNTWICNECAKKLGKLIDVRTDN